MDKSPSCALHPSQPSFHDKPLGSKPYPLIPSPFQKSPRSSPTSIPTSHDETIRHGRVANRHRSTSERILQACLMLAGVIFCYALTRDMLKPSSTATTTDTAKSTVLLHPPAARTYGSSWRHLLGFPPLPPPESDSEKKRRANILEKCRRTSLPSGPQSSTIPTSFHALANSGATATLIKNARILTGARNGTEIVFGDILFTSDVVDEAGVTRSQGEVLAVGYVPATLLTAFVPNAKSQLVLDEGVHGNLHVIDAKQKWVTPGLVDLHSHIGVYSSPALDGARDGNTHTTPIAPYLRALDGANTHDQSWKLTQAGGVTTIQILPGSAGDIGGQGVVMKVRRGGARTKTGKKDKIGASTMTFGRPPRKASRGDTQWGVVLEPHPSFHFEDNSTQGAGSEDYIPWRYMKHACGENPSGAYSQTRMDSGWYFRQAYNDANLLKKKQEVFCDNIHKHGLKDTDEFPDDLKLEALVDVLRGRVKLNVHCYEAVDLDFMVRLTNEFSFHIASFHHAGETYLVPDLLKKAWGGAPTIALFAANARKKREAYRGSEFAPSILAQHGIPVVVKSDHPVLNSRYLLYEAQQAHFYGLHPALAIASVTSTPAAALGLDHRIGQLSPGYDADVVIWDSHPLALGATPAQVFVDGVPQLESPHVLQKPPAFQEVPPTPDWEKERNETIRWEGLPPLRGRRSEEKRIRLVGVQNAWVRDAETGRVVNLLHQGDSLDGNKNHTVILEGGRVVGVDIPSSEVEVATTTVLDLKGGSIAPGLTTYGSPLGLVEIRLESSTNDGVVHDPLLDSVPSLLGHEPVRAVDGLQFQGRNALLAYRAGVTKAITAPSGRGFTQGVGTAFDLGAADAVDGGAVIQAETGLHIALSPTIPVSVSTQIRTLRSLLFSTEAWNEHWKKVREGKIPLVINVHSADIMATIIALKAEYEASTSATLWVTFAGALEAHILAEEIAEAGISVILQPVRPFPSLFEQRRILPGLPFTRETSITVLKEGGVNVAIGVGDEYDVRNLRFDVAWAALDADQRLTREDALALVTTNLEKALGLHSARRISEGDEDLVFYEGGDIFDLQSKVVGRLSGGVLELF